MKHKLSITAICLAVSANACAFNGKDYTFVVHDMEDLQAAQDAKAMWDRCHILNITVAANDSNNDGVVIDLHYAPDQTVSAVATMTQIRYHRTPHVASLLAHEMGHVFGLKHSKSEADIMSKDLGSLTVSDNDCDALNHRDTYYTNDSSD